MSRCSEPLLWFCESCSNPFELEEWQHHGRSCPACRGKSGIWRCGKCHGEFGQPSLGSEHPCLAKPSSSHGTKLISRSRGYSGDVPGPNPNLTKKGKKPEQKEVFEHFLKEQASPPVLVKTNNQVRGIRRYFSTKGRASRLEYWLVTLSTPFLLFGFVVVEAVFAAFFESSGLIEKGQSAGPAAAIFLMVGCPLVFWIYLAAFVRRRHDVGLSGRKRLNAFHTIYLLFKKGDPESNSYGPPKSK